MIFLFLDILASWHPGLLGTRFPDILASWHPGLLGTWHPGLPVS